MGRGSTRKSGDRKRAAENTAFEPDYRALVAAAGDMIYTLDLQGRFTSVNPAGLRVFECEPHELLGHDFVEILTPESAEIARRHFQQGLLGTENTPFFDVEARSKSGRVIHLEVRAGSLYQDGVCIGRQGIARDISELKALQAQVAEKSARIALLEERTRIALGLYARVAGLARDDASSGASPEAGLRHVQVAMLHASGEKIGLTALDLHVLELLSKGRSSREIALQVHRSPHTVKDHVKKIMQRLGATRRAEVVATALGLGLIPAES
jgi:PAS domain S-box-containing protein